MTHRETCPVCNPPTKPVHDCAQVERDNVDLHKALAEAIRLVHSAYEILSREHDDTECGPDCHVGDALGMLASAQHHMRPVLDRTSRPRVDGIPAGVRVEIDHSMQGNCDCAPGCMSAREGK